MKIIEKVEAKRCFFMYYLCEKYYKSKLLGKNTNKTPINEKWLLAKKKIKSYNLKFRIFCLLQLLLSYLLLAISLYYYDVIAAVFH